LPKLKTARLILFILVSTLLLISTEREPARAQGQYTSAAFTDSAASKLLSQVAEGLQGHSPRKMLSTFDLSRMTGGPVFKEQITAFFSQYDTIRVHFKLVEVTGNVAVVDAEMEETPRSALTAPQHKNMELRFTAEKVASGWKFVDVQPRTFFN